MIDLPEREPLAVLHSCGAGPSRVFRVPVDTIDVAAADVGSAFERLREFLRAHVDRACVGYLGYDLRDGVEALPRTIDDDWPIPVLRFSAFAEVAEFGAAEFGVTDDAHPPPLARPASVDAHVSRADYERRVAAVVEHIRAGDIFQANLTQPFSGTFDGDAQALFWRLCDVSPAPFAAFLTDGAGNSVISSSPEELVRRDGSRLRTQPIKGTRPRGTDPASDRALLEELLASEKDTAELAMIVDLLRNDFGKVARTGTVRTGPFPEHASFAQVHHLFATVTADLRDGVDHVDVIRAIFPGGSITGAPKLRAMEVIEDLEVVRRGVYTGAIGQIGPGDTMHLNVAIRTMQTAGPRVRLNAGGGITADSDPAAEYDETIAKATGMLRALGVEPMR